MDLDIDNVADTEIGWHSTRSNIREQSKVSENVLVSMQSCKIDQNRSILDNFIKSYKDDTQRKQNLCAMRYILDCLLCKIPGLCTDDSPKRLSFMLFEEGVDIFISFQNKLATKDRHLKKSFIDLICHPNYGLRVYIITVNNNKYITLRPENCDYDHIFAKLTKQEKVADDILTENLLSKFLMTMDSEWDKKVLKVILGMTRTRKELDELGIDSDQFNDNKNKVFEYFNIYEEVTKDAENVIKEKLDKNIIKYNDELKDLTSLLRQKQHIWNKTQKDEYENNIEDVEDKIEKTKNLLSNSSISNKPYKNMLNRTRDNIIKNRRLKLRKKGSGRKTLMDENDEQFLLQCIAEKSTAHGRRKDAVLYTDHRVKKKDFLNIVNFNRTSRNLPLLKSTTSIYNRSRPKNTRSLQSKKHIGMGLFCCKKPPKIEDNANILAHFCRAYKKNIIRYLSGVENKDLVLYRSIDDKAYLCPETSTGMTSSRAQSVYCPTDVENARKFKKYDFPKSMLSCTPGTFLYMQKSVENVNEDSECIKIEDQNVIVYVKPKYFVGSTGSIWGSHLIQNRHNEPLLHILPTEITKHSSHFVKIILKTNDIINYFVDQTNDEDISLVREGENEFRSYEICKLASLESNLMILLEDINNEVLINMDYETDLMNNLRQIMNTVINEIKIVSNNLQDLSFTGEALCPIINKFIESLQQMLRVCSNKVVQKSRTVDLTDAGPGVGITNHEVYYRIAQEIRICNYDYYMRHHLAPGDSSNNEVERMQSAVGDAICDGGYLNWEYKKKFEEVNATNIDDFRIKDLEKLEIDRMKFNAFKVCKEVKDRIDGAVAPTGFMKAYVTNDTDKMFFWDAKFLSAYIALKGTNKVLPGSNYYKKIDKFIGKHIIKGEKHLEFIKESCKEENCEFCASHAWIGPKCNRIPEPYPNYTAEKFKYLHICDTPSKVDNAERETNDFNPRCNLKKMYFTGEIKTNDLDQVRKFSEKYIVSENLVLTYLDTLDISTISRTVRNKENKDNREIEKKKEYKDYDWQKMYNERTLKLLKVASLNKYLIHHNLQHYNSFKKQHKIDAISTHISNWVQLDGNVNDDENNNDSSNDELVSDSDDDEVIVATHESSDDDDSAEQFDLNQDVQDVNEEEEGPLFHVTRSGRCASTHRIAKYRKDF